MVFNSELTNRCSIVKMADCFMSLVVGSSYASALSARTWYPSK